MTSTLITLGVDFFFLLDILEFYELLQAVCLPGYVCKCINNDVCAERTLPDALHVMRHVQPRLGELGNRERGRLGASLPPLHS